MSTLHLPALNTTFTPQAIFNPQRQSLLNEVRPLTQEQIDHAKVIVHHRAPGLMAMIFGAEQ